MQPDEARRLRQLDVDLDPTREGLRRRVNLEVELIGDGCRAVGQAQRRREERWA